jgi:hypothetical protein
MRLHKCNEVGKRPWFRVRQLERETRITMKNKYDRKTQLVDSLAMVMNHVADGDPLLVRRFGDHLSITGDGGISEISGDLNGFEGRVKFVGYKGDLDGNQIHRTLFEMGIPPLSVKTTQHLVIVEALVLSGWEATEEETAKAFLNKASTIYRTIRKMVQEGCK